mmetsp:Transcript_16092/g.46196  ORF Transcript_16092/g.46196 Transcript_16092/m.46196 type:complete len:84 (+) Transcript_16092:1811-2062(+)
MGRSARYRDNGHLVFGQRFNQLWAAASFLISQTKSAVLAPSKGVEVAGGRYCRGMVRSAVDIGDLYGQAAADGRADEWYEAQW